MKRLLSKRSGFTLAEIIIAFAIFAIMASMIVQVMNLMVKQKMRNKQFEDKLATQEQAFIARAKDMSYNEAGEVDGQIELKFKDKDNNDLSVDPIDFQLKNWDPENYKDGINYFVGNYDYDVDYSGSEYSGEGDPNGDGTNPEDIGGSTVMSRFDTRITGTKGIRSVKVVVNESGTPNVLNVTVTVDAGDVAAVNMGHTQVSIFFGDNTSGGTLYKNTGVSGLDGTVKYSIAKINDGNKTQDSLKKVKLCGENGVNVHCGYGGTTQTFKVEFKPIITGMNGGSPVYTNVKASDIGFGQNSTDGQTYIQFKNGDTYYANIFGAYLKPSEGAPSEGTPAA